LGFYGRKFLRKAHRWNGSPSEIATKNLNVCRSPQLAGEKVIHLKLSDVVFEPSGVIPSRPMRDAYFKLFGLPSVPANVSRSVQIEKFELESARQLIETMCGTGRTTPVVFHTDTEPEKQWSNANWLELAANLEKIGCVAFAVGFPEIESKSLFSQIRNCLSELTLALRTSPMVWESRASYCLAQALRMFGGQKAPSLSP
jgi:hypothetical protein